MLPRAEASDQPETVAHQLAVGQLVHLAPSLDAKRQDAEPAVRCGLRSRVETGARGEPVTPLLRQRDDLEDLDFAVDHGHVAGVAQPLPNGPGGGEVPAGRAVRRGGHQQRLVLPVEGQRHQVRCAVLRATGHPYIDVVGEPMLGVATTLSAGAGLRRSGAQFTALLTSSPIFASSAALSSLSAKEVGHMAPSSRFALSLKLNVAYLVSNFCALWKKQTTLPPLAYAGIPYQVFGERSGAAALTISWSRSAMARSGSCISAIFASTARSPSAFCASAFCSLARSFIAARSSAVNPLDFFAPIVPSCAGSSMSYSVQQEESTRGPTPPLLDS